MTAPGEIWVPVDTGQALDADPRKSNPCSRGGGCACRVLFAQIGASINTQIGPRDQPADRTSSGGGWSERPGAGGFVRRMHAESVSGLEPVLDRRGEALSILQHNIGFEVPELWVDYAINHGFKRVRAAKVPVCPDCGADVKRSLGQFVYYSTLRRLVECNRCGLVWTDARLDQEVLAGHFDRAYKDDTYFDVARRPIFQHLTGLVDRLAPIRGNVLDIGGAKGHLMHMVALERPDLRVVVNDLSESATRYATERFGIPTITGDVCALKREGTKYDVVVLSDVLYYEPKIVSLWSLLPKLVTNRGSVIIRVPNKLFLIRAYQAISTLFMSRDRRAMQTEIRFFNPEHVFVLSRRYLETRLRGLGFAEIRWLPSPPLFSTSLPSRAAKVISFHATRFANLVSGRRFVVTPSMIVTATYRQQGALPASLRR
jgi:2-polyprenyl-3-methyl-5-hydroxy-6-metoxy-1,4-benzoquinol methylase